MQPKIPANLESLLLDMPRLYDVDRHHPSRYDMQRPDGYLKKSYIRPSYHVDLVV